MHPAPPGPHAHRRRFEATAGTVRRSWLWMYVGLAAFMGGMAAINALLPRGAAGVAMPALIVLGVVGYGAYLVSVFRPRPVLLDVTGEGLSVDEGRGGAFPFSGAVLGPWHTAGIGVLAGTVLHLRGADKPFRVAGRDHRPAPALRLEAPPVEDAEAVLPAAEFDALLAALPSWVFQARWDAPATPPPLRIGLVANPSSSRRIFGLMLPWMGTIVLVGILGGVLEATGVGDTEIGRAITPVVTVALVVGGLALTIVRSLRRQAGFEIEIAGGELRLRDPAKGRVLAAAPIAQVAVGCGVHRYSGRGGSWEQTSLTLRVPGADEVSLAVFDTRYRWRDRVPSVGAARWLVGAPDWEALVDHLHLRRLLVVQDAGG